MDHHPILQPTGSNDGQCVSRNGRGEGEREVYGPPTAIADVSRFFFFPVFVSNACLSTY